MIRNGIDFVRRTDLDTFTPNVESIFIEIPKDAFHVKKNIIVGSIYRPPNTDCDAFMIYMKELLSKINLENKICYLAGDYNLNLLNAEKHMQTHDFIDALFMNYFVPLINKPTRIREKSATLIDNIFTNNVDSNSSQGILFTDVSDHLPVFCILDSEVNHAEPEYVTKRILSEKNITSFNCRLESIDWNHVIYCEDPQEAYSMFHKEFSSAYQASFPIKRIRIRYRNRKSWLTPGLKDAIKLKNKLYFKYHKHPTKSGEMKYRHYKKNLNIILERAEKDHYNKLFESYKSDMRKSWQLISEIINKKQKKETDESLSQY